MDNSVKSALDNLTTRFVEYSKQQTGHEPVSHDLYGVPSPCIVRADGEQVFWLPVRLEEEANLNNVENAMDIALHPDIHAFYTTQYAGDITAKFNDITLTLVQVWSEDDFIRLQENLIGHLFTQRRLKLAPTLFIATLESELELISLCNISGEVILELFGSKKREVLAPSLATFLNKLEIVI